MKGRLLPRIHHNREMDSLEKRRPQWTPYSSFRTTETDSSTWEGSPGPLLESIVNEVIDAQTGMPCEDGTNARNGNHERGPATPSVGDIVLRTPKPTAGTYFPEGIIECHSRTDRAIDVGSDGVLRKLGPAAIDSETRADRLGFLRRPRARGLGGVHLAAGDARAGLFHAIAECLPATAGTPTHRPQS